MNYLFYRRIRGPIFLLTFGVTALLHQWHVLSFGKSWPLYLIVYGVLRLVEGSALMASPPLPSYAPQSSQSPQTYEATGYDSAGYPAPGSVAPVPGTGLTTITAAGIQTARSIEEES